MNAPAYQFNQLNQFTQFAQDVRNGLGTSDHEQKQLPPSYLYDELGSALFEAITLLPEYGLTRADARLLRRHANDIADSMPPGTLVAELGSGTGSKTRPVLEAMGRWQAVDYYPIDLSAGALRACAAELSACARVHPINASYLDGLRRAARSRAQGQSLLLLFLGSTLGNFDRASGASFLADVRAALLPQDKLLIGIDLVKPASQMLLAYDDPAGVTAAFNRNLLARMNRELGANFDVRQFHHEARWNAEERRIEMHLRSARRQQVEIPAADLSALFEKGETIWTESSHKFKREELQQMASAAGFTPETCWTDSEWPFAECLWRA